MLWAAHDFVEKRERKKNTKIVTALPTRPILSDQCPEHGFWHKNIKIGLFYFLNEKIFVDDHIVNIVLLYLFCILV